MKLSLKSWVEKTAMSIRNLTKSKVAVYGDLFFATNILARHFVII